MKILYTVGSTVEQILGLKSSSAKPRKKKKKGLAALPKKAKSLVTSKNKKISSLKKQLAAAKSRVRSKAKRFRF